MTDFVSKVREFAHDAHDSILQKRKYTGLPYWKHTDEVASIVATVTDDVAVIAAAHCHDILEDVFPVNPFYSPTLIQDLFGDRVLSLVVDLTDVFVKEAYPDLNRKARKQKERERLGATSPASQTVKLADLISNTQDIVVNDADFARVYLREKVALLPHLIFGDKVLWARAARLADEGCLKLGVD